MTDYRLSKGKATLCLKILPSILNLAPSCHSLTSGEHSRTPCASTDPYQGKSTALVRISGGLTCEPAARDSSHFFGCYFHTSGQFLGAKCKPIGIVHRQPLLERGFGFASWVALHNVDCIP